MSGTSIPLIALCDRSGPFAASNSGRIAGIEHLVADLNATGGIFGAQLDLQFADTLGTAEGAQRAEARLFRQFESAPLVILCDIPTELALADILNEDNIPAFTLGAAAAPDSDLYALDATPAESLAFFIDDLLANWEQRKPLGAGEELRLAVLTWPADLVGQAVTPELTAYAESLGVQIVLNTELPAETDANIFDFVYELRNQNANALYINARSFGLAFALNAISNLGLGERLVIAAPGAAYDADFYTYLADPLFAEGLYLVSPWAWWSEELPGIVRGKAILAANSSGAEWTDWGYLQMVGAVDLTRRVLEDALLSDVNTLTRSAITDALTGLEDYPVFDGLYTVDFTNGQRSLNNLRVWQVGAAPGELILLGDYAEAPDLSD